MYFEAKIFVGNLRKASMLRLKNSQEQVLSNVLNEQVTLDSVDDGKNMMKKRMCGKKVLLVLDDVDHIEQLKALADSLNQKQEVNFALSRHAFGRENPLQGYKELSGKVIRYAAGLLLTIEVLGSFSLRIMHCMTHKEEMGKERLFRRSHPDEPNQHSRLWIYEEIEDILANDMGTEETRCLKLNKSRANATIVMQGFGKMKKLRYLEVNYADLESDPKFDHTSQYFSKSLKYLKCTFYPFSYLPKTFQSDNLVGLDMTWSRMVQLWEEGEKKDSQKLKFLFLSSQK
ncbi:Toll/interleukin-1 receptor domain-containing protein [Tanacetum coccineum]